MTKEDVLQKANDYCNEKGYTNETLTDDFKDKFSTFFAQKYAETSPDDAAMIEDLHFNLNTAFSATSKGITSKQKSFEAEKSELRNQIEELRKKNDKSTTKEIELSEEIKQKLNKLEQFEVEQRKRDKFKKVIGLAKKSIRDDLHKSFEKYADDFAVNLEETDDEQAKKLTDRFQDIFKDSIGDIKPLAPKQRQQAEDDIIENIKTVEL